MNRTACPNCGSENFCYGELKDYIFGSSDYTAVWECKCQNCDTQFMLYDFYTYTGSEVKEC